MSSAQKHVEKVLTGADIQMLDGRKLRIVHVGDYEPADYSVGILCGSVGVTTDDGGEYEVLDNGDVFVSGSDTPSASVGKAPDLWPDDDDWPDSEISVNPR